MARSDLSLLDLGLAAGTAPAKKSGEESGASLSVKEALEQSDWMLSLAVFNKIEAQASSGAGSSDLASTAAQSSGVPAGKRERAVALLLSLAESDEEQFLSKAGIAAGLEASATVLAVNESSGSFKIDGRLAMPSAPRSASGEDTAEAWVARSITSDPNDMDGSGSQIVCIDSLHMPHKSYVASDAMEETVDDTAATAAGAAAGGAAAGGAASGEDARTPAAAAAAEAATAVLGYQTPVPQHV